MLSYESLQIFRDIPKGTSAPTPEQLALVRHHMVGCLDLDTAYSAARFEADVMRLLPQLWQRSRYAVMCGGSMMYVDAVLNGIDELPEVSAGVRSHVLRMWESGGIELLRQTLQELDPAYLATADVNNHRRLIHAIEVSLESGVPYSSLCTGRKAVRPWHTLKIAIDRPRDVLFDRINSRVDAMIDAGLESEARSVYHMRCLNSLNTVGYKEMFAWFDGVMDRETAIARMKKNTRVYAKKQLTWLKRDESVIWLSDEGDAKGMAEEVLKLL
ncbi:MAG: tRNA (adenosine(37)-N6)-dimethylallyltransferase MiaA [Muribaculaceae bacterium]|nr:tRNA (adenosine(37)-N6)-dimethylallyltransferase MiaA [Muribaculaceae bacterium]